MNVLPRLLDDPGVSEQLRADLRLSQLHVAPFDTVSGLARLRAGLKSAGNPTSPPPPAGGLPSTYWKGLAAVGVAGVVGWVLLSGRSAPETSSALVRSQGPVVAAPVEAQEEPVGVGSGVTAVPEGPEAQPPALVKSPVQLSGQQQAPKAHIQRAPEVGKTDLFSEEIAQLASLRQLERTDPAAAVVLAREGHKKFAQGMLYEEREALLILSLGKIGQEGEAQRRAAEFSARFPRSAFISKMQQMAPVPRESPGAAP